MRLMLYFNTVENKIAKQKTTVLAVTVQISIVYIKYQAIYSSSLKQSTVAV